MRNRAARQRCYERDVSPHQAPLPVPVPRAPVILERDEAFDRSVVRAVADDPGVAGLEGRVR